MNLQSLIDSYIEFLKYEQQASPYTCTVRFYELHKFRKYMEWEAEIKDISEVKIHHLRSYLSRLRTEEAYQPVSLGNTVTALRAFYSFALNKGAVSANIAKKIKKPQVRPKEVEHFTWEEVEKLFLAVPQENSNYLRDLCILMLFYYCGLRLNELRNIKVNDFSSDLSELYVEKGKGDRSRLLPVHPFLQRTLKLYLKVGQANNTGYLFPGKTDKPLDKTRIYNIVRKCGERAQIKKRVSPHIFRHSFATHLHQKGVDINRLAQLLGHANIEKTVIYTHTGDEELKEAVRRL